MNRESRAGFLRWLYLGNSRNGESGHRETGGEDIQAEETGETEAVGQKHTPGAGEEQ